MSRLNDLIRQLRQKDPALADDIDREVGALADRRSFGLNFERHTPEVVELPGRRVRRGDKVRILPPRGAAPSAAGQSLWRIVSLSVADGVRTADLESLDGEDSVSIPTADVVVVAEFRDPIYPGLVSTGCIERGGDRPFHAVINAENFHALQTMLFTHRGNVDCIYIDPPYNSGAKDWKYNNDYVESDDLYRHSKWLAFVERRLALAKNLLKPENSTLIVAIDEKEVNRLGLLLEQSFPDAEIQMVSVVTNPSGTSRDLLSRVDEYAYFCFFGSARPADTADDLLSETEADGSETALHGIRWERLMRGGGTWYREKRKNLCYPVLLSNDRTRMIRAGSPLEGDESDRPTVIDGHPVAWPVRSDGRLGIWRVESRKLNTLIAKGYAQVTSRPDAEQPTLRYLLGGTVERIEAGELLATGRGDRGEILIEFPEDARVQRAKTVWRRPRHNAGGAGGAQLLNQLLADRGRFQFPKSLYAIEDILRIAVGENQEALVLDFFSGSGTTTHAVMRLNKQDGGNRRSIMITNNEVSAEEQTRLRRQQLRPGDEDWERWGICEYVTKPRIAAAITGVTPNGEPALGSYKFSDEFPIAQGFDENAEFFTLTYEAPLRIAGNREFSRIAPLLWLRAGSRGRRIEHLAEGWGVAETYGVIKDFDRTEDFLKALVDAPGVAIVFIVTDEDWLFESLCRELPEDVEPVRLYEAYLRNFEFESGRSAR